MFQVETINGKTILPIWHNLTKKQVTEYSPIIADRKAMTTALMTPAEMASELNKIKERNSSDLSANGATVMVPAGNYKENASLKLEL